MKFVLDTKYSEKELEFMNRHHCEILPEIKLSKTNFSKYETPRRMLKYGGVYVAEIFDDESNRLVWAVLSKRKGIYHFSAFFDSLDMLEQSL
ncbi:hypothetical protein D3Z51_15650 [Clostridiaceae bacterium]|nr:hypothetical protein [Clostridiaceae bacterium]RKI09575.1 hypothetical protein D7V81_17220 [bacterium 1XD21-70]